MRGMQCFKGIIYGLVILQLRFCPTGRQAETPAQLLSVQNH